MFPALPCSLVNSQPSPSDTGRVPLRVGVAIRIGTARTARTVEQLPDWMKTQRRHQSASSSHSGDYHRTGTYVFLI
jgi:hypothetical protein